jgi:ribosomal protein S1
MSKYSENQLVEAIVERVFPFGVFVRLADGTQAYIRRRELDLDADIDPTQVTNVGEKIIAKIITLSEQNKLIELSVREILPDPWLEFVKQFHEGDIVRGVVQSIHPRGAFVQVARGIRGFVSLKEMANWQVNKPEDILWVGDSIEAVITNIEIHEKRLAMSIKAGMSKHAQTLQISEKTVSLAAGENETFVAATTDIAPEEVPDPALIA